MSEQVIREDERQACWEDFMRLFDTIRGSGARTVRKHLQALGWKDLGTGDGKPLHRLDGSYVRKWLDKESRKP